jgi:hypothetical protein
MINSRETSNQTQVIGGKDRSVIRQQTELEVRRIILGLAEQFASVDIASTGELLHGATIEMLHLVAFIA